jgi:hypothetical protein
LATLATENAKLAILNAKNVSVTPTGNVKLAKMDNIYRWTMSV